MPIKRKEQKEHPDFVVGLLKWNRYSNKRQMPWKGEKDPYKIWLSEIILQQTRVEQGLKYYQRFIEAFPDIHQLARAPEKKIYKLWEGLGYYTRCKNLIATASYISKDLKGKFPETFEEIKKLKGVGPYTAAAISSFAFQKPYAVVDGNVFRVLSRIFGIDKPVDSTEGKKFFTNLANQLLYKKDPGTYNQAIMDFGAVVCKPAPVCKKCPFQKDCIAFLSNRISEMPVKNKKTKIRERWFYYLLPQYKGLYPICQRKEKDIWHNLFQFLLIETKGRVTYQSILSQAEKKGWLQKRSYLVKEVSPVIKQQLSHQTISGQFLRLTLQHKPQKIRGIVWVTDSDIKNYAFPKFINQYLQTGS
jgi:A/G-specific adenine glycosylase